MKIKPFYYYSHRFELRKNYSKRFRLYLKNTSVSVFQENIVGIAVILEKYVGISVLVTLVRPPPSWTGQGHHFVFQFMLTNQNESA